MRGRKDESNLPLYESQPPTWLPKSHATADLGTISPFLSVPYFG
jgi:mediator of RNA polymerase II transcription subunit 12